MNLNLNQLQAYPFARLRAAMHGIDAPAGITPIPLHIGEPKHPTPALITEALAQHLDKLALYPSTTGLPELKQTCAHWLQRRYPGVHVDAETEVLPVLGSREALFAFAQTVINASGSL